MNGKMKKNDHHNNNLAVSDNIGIKWVMLIYFCSGACSLIDEVVWVRLLKLTLGNTVYASTIVVSMFMGGLALGALIMGRFADGVKRRLRLYAILEICVTLSALALPLALKFMDRFYQWFYLNYEPSPGGLLALQVIVSAGILLVPAMLMGSTLPLLSRYITVLEERAGHLVGKLYALNTLGATLGCFLAGFVLIRVAGVMGTLYIAAGINLLVALGGWVLSVSYERVASSVDDMKPVIQPDPVMNGTGNQKYYLLLAAVFASGFISIGYELVWMRCFAYRLGCFTYVFSSVLTIYLLGNVIGAWIGSRLAKRLESPTIGFGVSMICLGLSGILFIPWICLWHKFLQFDIPMVQWVWKIPIARTMLLPLSHGVLLFLVPSITMGIGFPLAVQSWNNYKHKIGQTTGNVYGTNTIGAVLGGIATGFLLIPFFGSQASITILAVTGICAGMLIILLFDEKIILPRRIAYAVITALVIIAGIFIIPPDLLKRTLIKQMNTITIAAEEGVTTTASTHEYTDERGKRNLTLATSNIVVAGDSDMRSAQKTLGHLGVFLNRHSQDVLSIGFGSGETTACLSKHNLNRIDCVEVAPELVHMALKYFDHINLGKGLSEKVNMIYMDAKNYLHLTSKKYDIIINGANNPSHQGSAPLFAKEHLENAMAHLNNGGLFMTKLHLNAISRSNFDSILGTSLEVFPHVTLFFPVTRPYTFFYLVGSREKQLFSPPHIEEELNKYGVKESTSYLFFRNSIDVLSGYIGDENDIRRYLKKYTVNTDYKPFMEFNIDERVYLGEGIFFTKFLNIVRRGSLVNHIDWSGMSPSEKTKWVEEYRQVFNSSSYLLQAFGNKNIYRKLEINYSGLKNMPAYPALLNQQEEILEIIRMRLFNAEGKERMDADDALVVTKIKLQIYPESGALWLLRSWAFKRKNELNKALIAGEKAVYYSPHGIAARENIGELFLDLDQAEKAIFYFKEVIQLDPDAPSAHFSLGEALSRKGLYREAANSYQMALNLNPKFKVAQNRLEKVLKQAGR